ncbi:MAG: pantetheine-phosphate adenylyltransferase [Deltaproteobacteria bacterium]|nr:pantetheine-phosphate adenylyltransferase [Deltaproteobacteria bacterium]MBI3077943.1 pantetheine-phosphate adenylyltransferase [Deltaproteobacteria bacterium]
MTTRAVYPGSFDPVTNGHLDMIERGLNVFDHLIVAVAVNADKRCLFTVEERLDLIRRSLGDRPNVAVDTFSGLLIEYMRKRQVRVVLRGLRAISDFEYELQMALMNRRLAPEVETFFMMAGESYSYLSARIVKEIASMGGEVQGLVPPAALEALRRKFGGTR